MEINKEQFLHAIECNCQECLDKWVRIEAGNGIAVQPQKCLCIHALDGYETYKIDDNTIGVRPIWISVKDRLPDYHSTVLASDGEQVGEYIYMKSYLKYETGYFETDEGHGIEATHWMPLPHAPKE